MSYYKKNIFALAAMSCMVCFLMCALPALAASKDGNQIRMTVDPTVLPPIQPPSLPDTGDTTKAVKPEMKAQEGKVLEKDLPPDTAKAPPTPVVVIVEEAPEKTEQPVDKKEKPAPQVKPAPTPKAKPAVVTKPIPGVTGPRVVQKIGLDSTNSGFTLTVTCNGPVGDTTYMNLTGPRRLVVDLREPWKLGTRNVVRSTTGVVKHVVVGQHADRLRLVVHFRTPPAGKLDPIFKRVGNKLIVTVPMP